MPNGPITQGRYTKEAPPHISTYLEESHAPLIPQRDGIALLCLGRCPNGLRGRFITEWRHYRRFHSKWETCRERSRRRNCLVEQDL
ncbi:hypothetical protein JTE90_007540 [Oedothorax gibbosus]|uniref:Uncharacterized protein n=1 Tax=Oedothorax gibbosus TaxID=931172 RepID=A0AAV6VKU8_9ARAC|nr:hypothetical protein JTE90_007540 [Oedothorax gibbosus]